MHEFQFMNSTEDASVNFIARKGNSYIESRFVQRTPDYFIVYLSSQNGCNQSCRFCHLTQTKQTEFEQSTLHDYLVQAEEVLNYYVRKDKLIIRDDATKSSEYQPEKAVYFNFMARGEPLLNPVVRDNWNHLSWRLHTLQQKTVKPKVLESKFKLSTIIPNEVTTLDPYVQSDTYIYYSLYSMNPLFRKRWLPKAKPVNEALNLLKDFERKGGNIVFHWAFIKDENDFAQDVFDLRKALSAFTNPRVNIVRYNPYSANQGEESSDETIQKSINLIKDFANVKVIDRVGFDVKASCGMFV